MKRARSSRRTRLFAVVACGALVLAACSSAASAPPPPNPDKGLVQDQAVPAAVAHIPLIDQHGSTVTLASLRGKTVMLVPFLTLCTDICPMTTGNLSLVQRSLERAGQGSKVVIVELSVDPGRDDVARLAAYAHLTGATWQLVTESAADLARLATFFGFYYQRVPEDVPPSVDWLTHQPLTYDIDHSDGYVLIDPSGHVRFATSASPAFHGTLDPTLHSFLNAQGRSHLAHPDKPDWTAGGALSVLGWELGTTVQPAG
jgi:protein SCO1/2